MPKGTGVERADLSGLRIVKRVSGERIRSERRRRHIRQEDLALQLGMSPKWLREIEGGNPGTRLEEHLLVAGTLGLPTAYIGLAILYVMRGAIVPLHVLYEDVDDLERQCMNMVADMTIKSVSTDAPAISSACTDRSK